VQQHTNRYTHFYTVLLCLIAVGMPNLNILMSIGSILLFVLWLIYPGPVKGWNSLRKNKGALMLIGLYLIHIVWLWNTDDYFYAWKDLRIKLPILIFGLVLGSVTLSRKQIKLTFLALATGVWIASFTGYYLYFTSVNPDLDYRSLVPGISHIRLSLMMVMVVATVIYYWREIEISWRIAAGVTVANILVFFNLIQSATGIIILLTLFVCISLIFARRQYGSRALGWTACVFALLIFFFGVSSYYYYQKQFTSDEILTDLPATTALGNTYSHYTEAGYVENGTYVFNNICEGELMAAWNERSDLKVSYDPKLDEPVIGALIRYLSSKHLTKDRQGVMALSAADIEWIEAGYPSVIYVEKSGLALRYHTMMFGIHQYAISGNASGISFLQRMVYWQAAIGLIRRHPVVGIGTGDVKKAFYDIYEEEHSNLEPQYRNRAHNQFLTFFVSFGVAGFLLFIAVLLYPFIFSRPGFLFSAFLLIAFLSCLTEDTLETQAGVTFFAFFYGLFSSSEMGTTSAGAD